MVVSGRDVLEGGSGGRSGLTIVIGSTPAMCGIVIFKGACVMISSTDFGVVACFFGYGLSPVALTPAFYISIHIKCTCMVPACIKLRILDVWGGCLAKVTGSPARDIVGCVNGASVETGNV